MNFLSEIESNQSLKDIRTFLMNHKDSMSAYIVGGYVRDLVMKRKSNDIDIVCVGIKGIDFAKRLSEFLNIGSKVRYFNNQKNTQIEIAVCKEILLSEKNLETEEKNHVCFYSISPQKAFHFNLFLKQIGNYHLI